MNLRKLDKYSHYWNKEKTDWAVEGKDGRWWIFRGPASSKARNKKKMKIKKKKESSIILTKPYFLLIIIIISAILGVSLALNVVYYLLR